MTYTKLYTFTPNATYKNVTIYETYNTKYYHIRNVLYKILPYTKRIIQNVTDPDKEIESLPQTLII